MRFITYYHTVKHLKFSQIYYRIIKCFLKPKPKSITSQSAPLIGEWICYYLYEQKLFADNNVKFLNKQGVVDSKSDWNTPSEDKLWLYNLHYFDDLCAIDSDKRRALQFDFINKWIIDNPAPLGNGWEPYTSSLRIVNWIKSFLSGMTPNQMMLDSLAQQVDYLSQNLERHILGNHYFSNGKALIFAGLYFQGEYAGKWFEMGLEIYSKELDEQILSDGGNFELTPMYHTIMLVDLLDIQNIFRVFPDNVDNSIVDKTKKYALRMFKWLNAMSHSDGGISFFNDSVFGIAPKLPQVLEYAHQIGISPPCNFTPSINELLVSDLSNTGFVSVKSSDFTLIADLGEVGPSYQPGHAHADTLSFELSLFNQRIFVNSGISEYGLSKERLRQRQSAAHNTVVVNGLDSSQVWGGFRVAKRANILERDVKQLDDGAVVFGASHNGFKKQGVNCIHNRTWQVQSKGIIINDNLIGKYKNAFGYLHLHPDVIISSISNREIKLTTRDYFVILKIVGAEVTVENSTWHPEFGITFSNKKLCFKFKSNSMRIELAWGFI